jgi:outer membrane protein assembly factor BamA
VDRRNDFKWDDVRLINYSYERNGWNVTMRFPITLNPKYAITANYTLLISEVFPTQNVIMWSGTWQNGTISEMSFRFTP